MSNYRISRRQFITAAGTIFTLPLLESLFPFSKTLAQAAGDPKRYVMVYFPSGTYNRPDKPIWAVPAGNLSAANTSLALSPFSNYYSEMTSINGMRFDNYIPFYKVILDGHGACAAAYMTGADPTQSNTMTSFENIIGDQIGKSAFILSGGVTSAFTPQCAFISYRNGVGNTGISNPGDLYRQLLGKIVPTAPPVTPTNAKSILDSSLADFNSFMGTLGKTDKTKMDEFLTAFRNLESKILSSEAPIASQAFTCVKPTFDQNLDGSNSKEDPKFDVNLYLPKFYAFNDLIKIAFACDITRSVSIMVDMETSSRTFASAPANLIYKGADIGNGVTSHLGMSHASDTGDAGYNIAVTRDRVLMSIAIDLTNKLKSTADPSGSSILDNTIIQTGFGIEDGDHNYGRDVRPLVLLGGRNMLSSRGTSIDINSGYTLKDLQYTISQKLGLTGLSNFAGSTNMIKL